ncbi:primosomal protein DnaI [Lactobacillus apis]|uniref:Primosome component (Helicase loader) n=1 Tax=Lactobacillus apis TaxID=303541 RepID=A0A0F4LTG4_9LACO|nr:primosomal protein DnaI [Lactobacillus apis]KJY61633.1 Primosome component (Helicase loader) [Lactobacillus apis]
MEPINKFISAKNHPAAKKIDPAQIRQQVLAEPAVSQFISAHQNKITDEMIDKSMSALFEFYLFQQNKKDPVTQGFKPKLILNTNAIDITYVPEDSKIEHDREVSARKNLRLIDLPTSLHDVKLSQVEITPERKQAMADIGQFLSAYSKNIHQKGLFLSGSFGVGKTFILAGLANSLAMMNKRVVFMHLPNFIAGLSSHFNDNSLPEEVQRISNCDVLILDDIGAENLSQWSRDEVLAVILQSRMDNQLPTFFSSNFSMNDLEEHFKETKNAIDPVKAARLMERVRTLAKEVVVSGPNRRR